MRLLAITTRRHLPGRPARGEVTHMCPLPRTVLAAAARHMVDGMVDPKQMEHEPFQRLIDDEPQHKGCRRCGADEPLPCR